MTSLTNEHEERFVVADRRRFTWERCRADIAPFVTRHVTWRALAAGDIRSKYRRTFLGPWWITATNGLTALIMGLVAGRFLGADTKTYLPNFMVSITIWNFISSSLSESCFTMISAGGMIKAVDMPILIHVMRMVQRNLIIFLHNIAVVPIIWLIFPWRLGFEILLCVPGLAIVYVFVVERFDHRLDDMRALSRRSSGRGRGAPALVFHLSDHLDTIADPRRRTHRRAQSDRLSAGDYARPRHGERARSDELDRRRRLRRAADCQP